MTNLLVLAAAAAAAFGSTVPPPGPDPDPDPPVTLAIPDPIDATVAAMRPAGRSLGLFTVSPTDPEADYTTVGAAIEAAKAVQIAAGKQDAVAWPSSLGPDYRVDIVLGPGTYEEHVGGSAWINLYAAAGTELGDVVIYDDTSSSGVLHCFGATYVEGIALVCGGTGIGYPAAGSGPKYPLHLGADGTLTFVNVRLVPTQEAGSATAAVGMDGDDGTQVTFYKCDIQDSPSSTWLANMHSASGNTVPLILAFIDCTLANVVQYDDLGTGLADQVYFIGNTGGSLSVDGANVVIHTSGTWPIPDPNSARDEAYFYPSRVGEAHTLPGHTVGDSAAFTPPTNRIYLVPVEIPAAIHATHYGVTAAASGGSWAGWMGRLPDPPNGAPAISPSTAITSAGLKQGKHFYYYDFYPGEEIAWVAAAFSAGASVMGSVSLAGLVDCYYSDDGGATVTHAAAGTAIPLVQIRSAS